MIYWIGLNLNVIYVINFDLIYLDVYNLYVLIYIYFGYIFVYMIRLSDQL